MLSRVVRCSLKCRLSELHFFCDCMIKLCRHTTFSLYMHQRIDVMGCVLPQAVGNDATKASVYTLCEKACFQFSCTYQEMEFLCSTVILTSLGAADYFPRWLQHFVLLPATFCVSNFSASLSVLTV